ncbi:MAG TPA: sugar transferase [Gaiellaceae bacterium]|jgi:exopolysaccharide biosynthesis polyprenyl glycosylphosphotransferase|nr:sugar transferase [Gaiellaceae bacterium]
MSVPVKMQQPSPPEDARAIRPFRLQRNPLRAFFRRAGSILVLAAIDISGLTVGLYLALALRSWIRDPSPIFWNLLWDLETDWLAFLILLVLLVFWRNGLYGPRELREGSGKVVASVALVALLTLAFAIGTGQHFTTFGLYVVGGICVAMTISLLRWSYETVSGAVLRSRGVRRRVLLVGSPGQVAHLRATLGASRGGIDYEFAGGVEPGPAVAAALVESALDELIVADDGLSETELLEIVDSSHRRGVRVRIAPRTTELLIERGEYVPGQAVPLFDVRPPAFAGADFALKRSFDIVVSAFIVVIGLPVWLVIAALVKLTSRGPVFFADERVGLGEENFRMLKFRTMVAGAAGRQAALEEANEASGALFKIRDDPRVTGVGRVLRRFSIDEIPNVVNVLRGNMSLVGPRPLPLRDYAKLEPWHRRRSNVLPGMTGLWQIAGRSDLSFDDLVRLDFYYLENWSLWLDITILGKTLPAVVARRGAY